MLENTDGTIRETVNIVYTRCKKNHNTICVKHQYTSANTNNANTTCAHLLTTGVKEGNALDIELAVVYPIKSA